MKKTPVMPIKRYPKILALAVILLGSLPLIALLQYHWLAQLSRAEYNQMRSNLFNVANRFSQDIDRETMSAHLVFIGSNMSTQSDRSQALMEGLNRWEFLSSYPDILGSLYWIEGDELNQPKLLRFNELDSKLSATAWSSSLVEWLAEQPWYQDLPLPAIAMETADIISPIPFSAALGTNLPAHDALFALQMEMLVNGQPNQILLAFDEEQIFEQMIPSLVEDHFGNAQNTEYDILITERDAPDQVLFRSDPSLTANSFSGDDLSMDIGIPDQPHMIGLFAQLTKESTSISPMDVLEMVKEGFRTQRFPTGSFVQDQLDASQEKEFRPVRKWQLFIKHKAGPLNQIVAKARSRNLMISFAVLLILCLSIILIIIYSRRTQQLADQQMAFVAGVSHELRTPLAVVHAAGENLKDGLVSSSSETQAYGKLIVDESQSLMNTIEQVLTYAGISFGNAPPLATEIDLNHLLHKIIDSHREALSTFHVQLDLENELPVIRGDWEAIYTVLQNLLLNAIKYSNGQKWIRIQSLRSSQEKASVEIRLQDKGLGISPEDQKNIFDPFFRSNHIRKTQIRGNGLGLSIARQIVHVHGGSIEVESSPGKGSTFIVRLKETPPKTSHLHE